LSIAAAPKDSGAPPDDDIAALAKGGRTNFFGFVLRLIARLPFLFIAGHFYGAEVLGRFAYAIIVIEFAAQLATLGLKRGLAQQLRSTDQPHVCVVWDAMLAALIASAFASAVLMMFPQAMFPTSERHGADFLLPLVIFGIAGADVALSALAYRHNIAATVRARAIVEPWTISIAAGALAFYSTRDGLIIAYVISIAAGLLASLIPLLQAYGAPRGWTPHPGRAWHMARQNLPLAAADAIEWGSRRLDVAILGLFVAPYFVGVYYVAQQVASLPQRLKTSFDPILAPVLTERLAHKDYPAVARQVRQVGFWIIAAQMGIALALGMPGMALMSLVGAAFAGGALALAFLLAAEVVAATAAVSEAALVYVARKRNLMISVLMIVVQILLTVGILTAITLFDLPAERRELYQTAGAALALGLSLALASVLKANLLERLLGHPVHGWRASMLWAAAAAALVGVGVRFLPDWLQLAAGIPLILGTFCLVVWRYGFTAEDRVLFRLRKGEEPSLPDLAH
jgi:O-antigen/teichoic acid export membrane protein